MKAKLLLAAIGAVFTQAALAADIHYGYWSVPSSTRPKASAPAHKDRRLTQIPYGYWSLPTPREATRTPEASIDNRLVINNR